MPDVLSQGLTRITALAGMSCLQVVQRFTSVMTRTLVRFGILAAHLNELSMRTMHVIR